MKNNKGSAKAVLILVLAIVLVLGGVFAYFYIDITQIRFDYTNSHISVCNTEEDALLGEQGYGMNYPFFGNSNIISDGGSTYSIHIWPMGEATERNIPVYMAVNDVLSEYGYELMKEYRNNLKMDYTVEKDDKTIKVEFTSIAYPDGVDKEGITLKKTFVFNIENASRNNMPTLISES